MNYTDWAIDGESTQELHRLGSRRGTESNGLYRLVPREAHQPQRNPLIQSKCGWILIANGTIFTVTDCVQDLELSVDR